MRAGPCGCAGGKRAACTDADDVAYPLHLHLILNPNLQAVAAGAVVEGAMVVPVAVAPVVDHPGDRSRLRVVVAEGRKHEVRSWALGHWALQCTLRHALSPIFEHNGRLHVRE